MKVIDLIIKLQKLDPNIDVMFDMTNDNAEILEWIDIKDNTPKERQQVIIYFKNKAGWHTETCYWDGENFIDLCEICGHKETYKHNAPITHWMPLPKPPKTK